MSTLPISAYLRTLLDDQESQQGGKAVANKRSWRSAQFAERLKANVELGSELIALTKQLHKQGHIKEAEQLLALVKQHLDNNEKLQQVVGETLLDIVS